MARSHHRKKHRSHLRLFKHNYETGQAGSGNSNATTILMIGGALAGIAIGYFAGSELLYMAIGLLVGGTAGYYLGKSMDREV